MSDEQDDAIARAFAAVRAEYARKNGYGPDEPDDTAPVSPRALARQLADIRRAEAGLPPLPPANHTPPTLRPLVCWPAWEAIIQLTKSAGYVRPQSTTAVGSSHFIVDTIMHPLQSWTDARPSDRSAGDTERIAKGLPPVWIIFDIDCWKGRVQRTINVTGLDDDVLSTVVLDYQLADSAHIEPAAFKSKTSKLSALLEVWGHGYLVPSQTPTTLPFPHRRKRLQRKPWEIAW